MRNPRELTRADILSTASRFRWFRKLPKWTVIVDNRELPARPLVLEAAGVGRISFSGPGAGGDPTAAAILADVREILCSRSHASPQPPREVLVRPAAHLPRSRYLRVPGRSPVLTRPTSRAASLEGCPPGSVSIAVLEAA